MGIFNKEGDKFMKKTDLLFALFIMFAGFLIVAGAIVMLKSADFAPEALPFFVLGGIFALAGFIGLLWAEKKDKD